MAETTRICPICNGHLDRPGSVMCGSRHQTTEAQIIAINHTAGTNVIEIRVMYPIPGHAGQQHRGWLRAWKSGRLAKLIEECTWE